MIGHRLLEVLQSTIISHSPALIEPGDHVLVAVSGGPDSLSLLHALHTLSDALQLSSLTAAHLDHGLRGEESAADAAFVAEFCARIGRPCVLGHCDVASRRRVDRIGVQEAARLERYAFLEGVQRDLGATKIATAHTQDDRVETVLFNILRGTGPEGLRGIPYRRARFVRPLLDVRRIEVLDYCSDHGLNPRTDPSNLSSEHYTRNRIRLELLPLLEREYFPSARAALLRLSQVAGRDVNFLMETARAALPSLTISLLPTSQIYSADKMRELHPSILRYVLRAVILEARGTTVGILQEHLEPIVAAIQNPPARPFGITTPAPNIGIRVTKRKVTLKSNLENDSR